MINLIQPITVQQAYDGITHARRWASWNWWWRMVDDDDGDGFPSPEPRTNSRSTCIFYIFQKVALWSFRSFRERLFLHINNTMVILLKTTSVRVSSIQIMQVRVQNKGKSVWKSRYIGDVSTPPSLNLCLSSSNSVDKLKVIKKNFYKLCLLLLL